MTIFAHPSHLFNWQHQCLGFSFVYRIECRWKSAQSGVVNWQHQTLK